MIQAERMSAWRTRLGIYRAQLVIPSRRGVWLAFWTIRGTWPPEIDVLECVNAAWGAAYTSDKMSSAQHLGKFGSDRRHRVIGLPARMKQWGFAPDFNFNTQVHDSACLITEETITVFVDGIETVLQERPRGRGGGDDGGAALGQSRRAGGGLGAYATEQVADLLVYAVLEG